MPQSKKRKDHAHPHPDFIPHQKKRKSSIPVVMITCCLFAIGIGWFASEGSAVGIIAGALCGLVIGYYAGKQLDKALDKS
jgi:hypothetical protein